MKPICRTYSSLFLALTATRLKPTRPNNEVCSRFVLNSWLCQVLRSLATVGKGTAFHMGIEHTGAGQHPVTESQRFHRNEKDSGGNCSHTAANKLNEANMLNIFFPVLGFDGNALETD